MELWSPSSIELAASPIAAALALRAFLRLLEVDLVTLRDGVADDAVSAPPAATENPAERVAAGAAADEGSANGTAGGTASGTAGGTAVGTPLEIRVDRSDGKSSPRAAASMSSIASAASRHPLLSGAPRGQGRPRRGARILFTLTNANNYYKTLQL